MAAHPEIKQYAAPNVISVTEEADKRLANMFTRLLADSCLTQTQASIKQGGPAALEAAFQTLGQLAMQELMSDAQVSATMGTFQKHLDQNKFSKALGGN